MIEAVFLLPVCKKDAERVVWTIKSIRKNCSNYYIYVIVDCPPEDFPATAASGQNTELVYPRKLSKGDWGQVWDNRAEVMVRALERNDLSPECIFVKMDADAMVVRSGLVERAQTIFRHYPCCGQLGQCYFNISGYPLENKGYANYFRKRTALFGLIKAFVILCSQKFNLKEALRLTLRLKYLFVSASDNGYKPGVFAIGGAYILRYDAVRKMHEAGWLTDSPLSKVLRGVDDFTTTPHIYAVGYKACDDVGVGGIFAIVKELWIHPIELCQRGHYIIHPVKYGVTLQKPYMSESELADFFLNYEYKQEE